MSVNQRIINFINEVGVQDILKKTNLGQSLVYKLKETGGANSTTMTEIFTGYPHLSADWIFKGIGKMWNLENNGIVNEPEPDYEKRKEKPKPPLSISKEEYLLKAIEMLQVEVFRLRERVEQLEKKK